MVTSLRFWCFYFLFSAGVLLYSLWYRNYVVCTSILVIQISFKGIIRWACFYFVVMRTYDKGGTFQ